jgi:hypothetical protein
VTNPSNGNPDLGSDGAAPRQPCLIAYIGDPFNPPIMAIISVAARLQEVLLATGALSEGDPVPFPELFHPEAGNSLPSKYVRK